MRHIKLGLMLVVVVAVFVVAQQSAHAQREYPEWYAWTYDEGIYLTHDVEHHFDLARYDFERRDMGHAAEQILTAADYMKLAAGRASTKEDKEALILSIEELEALANGVVTGKITTVNELNDVFARANYVLVTHHLWKAQEALKKNEPEAANNELKAASYHLERSMAWSGKSAIAKAKAGTVSKLKEGPVVDGRVLASLTMDLAHHFNLAREQFQKKDLKAAAEQIRVATVLLKLEASHSPEEARKAIENSAGGLEKLAGEMESGTTRITAGQLDATFARIDLILAERDYQTASESSRKKEPQNTGYSLRAAAAALANASELLGGEEQKSVHAIMDATEPAAAKLIKGTEVPTADISKIVGDGTKAAEELGKALPRAE